MFATTTLNRSPRSRGGGDAIEGRWGGGHQQQQQQARVMSPSLSTPLLSALDAPGEHYNHQHAAPVSSRYPDALALTEPGALPLSTSPRRGGKLHGLGFGAGGSGTVAATRRLRRQLLLLLLALASIACAGLLLAGLSSGNGGSGSGRGATPESLSSSGTAGATAAAATGAAAASGAEVAVEFELPGLVLPLRQALDLSLPLQPQERQQESRLETQQQQQHEQQQQQPARLFVGIISGCCTPQAQAKRAAVRDTWLRRAREQHPSLGARFFLAQPADGRGTGDGTGGGAGRGSGSAHGHGAAGAGVEDAVRLLQPEAAVHADMVVVRGPDTYRDLPNKTLRMLRYALAASSAAAGAAAAGSGGVGDGRAGGGVRRIIGSALFGGNGLGGGGGGSAAVEGGSSYFYSHVLKVDDDCYVRVPPLLRALQYSSVLASVRDELAREQPRVESLRAAIQEMDAAAAPAANPALRDAYLREVRTGEAIVAVARGQLEWLQGPEGARFRGGAVGGRLYLGAVSNRAGFFPVRDPASKWYIPYEALPDDQAPLGLRYLSGWGYVLSADVAAHVVATAERYRSSSGGGGNGSDVSDGPPPQWFQALPWEDVVVGALAQPLMGGPIHMQGFQEAWRGCPNVTAVRHLDVDAPRLMAGLYAQDVSGLWDARPVQCTSGDFALGDYFGWRRWRDALPNVERV